MFLYHIESKILLMIARQKKYIKICNEIWIIFGILDGLLKNCMKKECTSTCTNMSASADALRIYIYIYIYIFIYFFNHIPLLKNRNTYFYEL